MTFLILIYIVSIVIVKAFQIMEKPVKNIFQFLLSTLISLQSSGQRQADNWMVGAYEHWNFSTGTMVFQRYLPHYLFSNSGISTQSDANGQLLFYADNANIYNRTDSLMFKLKPVAYDYEGGSGLCGFSLPGNDSLYYVFNIGSYFYGNVSYNPVHKETYLYYTVINMKANHGYGAVIDSNRVLGGIGNSVSAKITATLHCNKKDVWIIGHFKNSAKYFAYLITANGAVSSPIISNCTMIPGDSISSLYSIGSIKVSPDGSKIANTSVGGLDMIELCDFNSSTGVISNPKILRVRPSYAFPLTNSSGDGPFGVEFSPSGQFLYTTANYTFSHPVYAQSLTSLLHQFDVSSNIESAIMASKVLLDTFEFIQAHGMQIANNGVIYVSMFAANYQSIPFPDNPGVSCGFQKAPIIVTDPRIGGQVRLPSFIQSYFRYPIVATGNCQFQNVQFRLRNINSISSVLWDFGDPTSGLNDRSSSLSPTHIYSTEGIFPLKLIVYNTNGCSPDTIHKSISAGQFKVYLGNDTTICTGASLKLKVSIPNATILWNDGTLDSTITITHAGYYSVKVNLDDCEATDTILVVEKSAPSFSLGADTRTLRYALIAVLISNLRQIIQAQCIVGVMVGQEFQLIFSILDYTG